MRTQIETICVGNAAALDRDVNSWIENNAAGDGVTDIKFSHNISQRGHHTFTAMIIYKA